VKLMERPEECTLMLDKDALEDAQISFNQLCSVLTQNFLVQNGKSCGDAYTIIQDVGARIWESAVNAPTPAAGEARRLQGRWLILLASRRRAIPIPMADDLPTDLARLAAISGYAGDPLANLGPVMVAAERWYAREHIQIASLVTVQDTRVGVTLYDVAFVVEDDEKAAKSTVKRWIDSKKIKAQPLGKCPVDGRRQIYRLSEILDDVKTILTLSPIEQSRLRKALTAKCRSAVGV
jgi:hypothetical protein